MCCNNCLADPTFQFYLTLALVGLASLLGHVTSTIYNARCRRPRQAPGNAA